MNIRFWNSTNSLIIYIIIYISLSTKNIPTSFRNKKKSCP